MTTTLPEAPTTTLHDVSLARLAGEVARQAASKRDVIADTRRVNLVAPEADTTDDSPKPTLVSLDMPGGVEDFGVTRHAHQQIAETVKVPWRTYDRLLGNHPDLLAHLTNGLLAREPQKRMLRLLDGRVRAVLSDRYRPRDNADLLERLLPVLAEFPDVQFKRCDLTETRLYVKTWLPGLAVQVTPKVNDVIRGGVIISNSEVGSGSLYVYPYTDRLICLNGAVHTTFGQRRIHVGKRIESTEEAYELYSDATMRLDDDAFFAKCADTVRGCLNSAVFDAIAQQMRDLADIQIGGNAVDQIEEIAKRESFTGEEQTSMLQHLIEGGDLSGWGYVNAITRTARDLGSPDRQTELEMLAGRMIAEPGWAHAAAS